MDTKDIVPAVVYKIELEKLFLKEFYSDNYFYFIGDVHSFPYKIAESNENGKFEYAVVDDEKVVGYIGYTVDFYNSRVCNFGLYSFDEGNLKVPKVLNFIMEELYNRFHRIEFCCIGGNHASRAYDTWTKKHNGTKHVLRDVTKDRYGKYHDSYIYEVINENIKG